MKVERDLIIYEMLEEIPLTFEYESESASLKLKEGYYEILTEVNKLSTDNMHTIGEQHASL